jgi:hypothetical protein
MLPKSHSVSHTTFSLPTAWVHRSSSWVSTHGLVLSLAFLVLGLPARPGPFFFPPSIKQITFQKNGFYHPLAQQPGIALPRQLAASSNEVFIRFATPKYGIGHVFARAFAENLKASQFLMAQKVYLRLHGETTEIV